jgi:hypothetical protein
MKKKIILFGEKGPLTDFVEKNNIGYAVFPENMYEKLCYILENHNNDYYRRDYSIDISDMSIPKLTERLQLIIK